MNTTESSTLGDAGQFGHSLTSLVLQRLALLALATMLACASACANHAGDSGWISVTIAAGVVWALWLLWRSATGDVAVPRHHLYIFLFVPIGIYLAHLFTANIHQNSQRLDLIGEADGALVVRLALLALTVLLVQDVLPRVPHLRWLVLTLSSIAVLGGLLRIGTTGLEQTPPALVLSSLSALVMILSQMPYSVSSATVGEAYPTSLAVVLEKVRPALFVLPAVLGAWLLAQTIAQPSSWILAGLCVGLALLAGVLMPLRRALKAGLAGLILFAAAVGAAYTHWPTMQEHLGLLGAWQRAGPMGDAHSAGWVIIGRSTGAVGLVSLVLGMAFCMIRSLFVARNSYGQEQAQAILWLAATTLSGLALLSDGGLALPSSVVIAGFAFGLLPCMLGHEQKTIHGWPVAMIFGFVLLVLGLAKRLLEDPLCGCMVDDRIAHYLAGVVACGVFIWQCRVRRWWSSLAPMAVAAILLSLGEVAQEELSTRQFDYGDMFYDTLGSVTMWVAFCLVLLAGRLERRIRRSAMGRERYSHPDPTTPHGCEVHRAGSDPAAAGRARSAATQAP